MRLSAGSPVSDPRPAFGWAKLSLVVLLLTAGSTFWVIRSAGTEPPPASAQRTPPAPAQSAPQSGAKGRVPVFAADDPRLAKLELFATWPKQKPELVLVLSGQMYGYLQKCGCSSPQKGGLERRYNFLDWLRLARGWDVLPLDLGDLAGPEKGRLHKQSLLKYQVAMESLREMGYRAIGVGKEEFRFPLIDALATFSLQHPEAHPRVLNANILQREVNFPSAEGEGSMLRTADVYAGRSMKVGLASIIGRSLIAEVNKIDPKVEFAEDSQEALKVALKEIQAQLKGPADLNVLLYQGEYEDAPRVAQLMPQFGVIVCRSKESEPPATPDQVGDSVVVRVGHKGQNVGVLGVFRENGKLSYHYEKVTIGEDFETPQAREADQPILQKYEWYAREVRDRGYLQQFPKAPHPLAASYPDKKVGFVGSDACRACHPLEHQAYSKTKHSHAYEALSEVAKHPSLRNFDGECIVCHTVGFSYLGGYDGTAKTAHLKNVGCENCHGPGSLHAANPRLPDYLTGLSPWKANPEDRLPDAAVMAKLLEAKTPDERTKLITPAQEKMLIKIDDICQKCHDTDNDPHYRFEKYWPQVNHTGLKP